MVTPPETSITAPLMYDASSDASHAYVLAISSGCAEPAHGHLVLDHPEHLVGHRRENGSVDVARADRVGADALAAELARPGLDHADHAELGRGVVGLAEVAVDADDGRGVEDAARVLGQHDVDDGLGAVVDALQVDVDDTVELVLAHLLELRVLHDAGVVDQGVDPAPLGHDAVDHRGDAFLVRDVDPEADAPRRPRTRPARPSAGRTSRLMSQTATLAPSLANLRAVARPMPWPAPVMIETLPARRMWCFSLSLGWCTRCPAAGLESAAQSAPNIAALGASHKVKLTNK